MFGPRKIWQPSPDPNCQTDQQIGLTRAALKGNEAKATSSKRLFLNFPAHCNRVARWYIFKPKIPIWVHFVGSRNGKCFFLWSFGLLYGHLVYFTAIWYFL
jgi:hypothetical protein